MGSEPTIKSMIGFSWKASKEMLFPFHFKRWLKVLVIVWLAAAGVQGCASSFKLPARSKNTKTQALQQKAAPVPPLPFNAPVGSEPTAPAGEVAPAAVQDQNPIEIPVPQKSTSLSAPLVLMIGGMLLAVVFGIVAVWINCRFNFVLLNFLATKELAILEPFRQSKAVGNSYFKWSLAFLLVGISALLGVVLLASFLGIFLKGHAVVGTLAVLVGSLLVLALFVVGIIAGIVVRDFVTPIMYREKILLQEAWARFLQMRACNVRSIAKYVLALMGFGLVAMVLQTVVGIAVFLAGFLGGGVLVLPGIFLIKVIPLLKAPLLILGMVVGVALILAVLVAIQMILLPVAIFFRMFALAYLTRLYPDCDLLNFKTQG